MCCDMQGQPFWGSGSIRCPTDCYCCTYVRLFLGRGFGEQAVFSVHCNISHSTLISSASPSLPSHHLPLPACIPLLPPPHPTSTHIKKGKLLPV